MAQKIGVLIEPLNGKIDATTAGLISITIPVSVGFQAIEGVFKLALRDSLSAQWQYSNVYDTISAEALNWWNE